MLLAIIKSQLQPFMKVSSCTFSASSKYLQYIKRENSQVVGGYADAIKVDSSANIVFCSGSIATHVKITLFFFLFALSRKMQTYLWNNKPKWQSLNFLLIIMQAMDYIKAILEAGNSDFSNVIKSSIFLTVQIQLIYIFYVLIKNMDDFTKVNEIYLKYFDQNCIPAGTVLAVKDLPKNAKVEIEVVACQKK